MKVNRELFLAITLYMNAIKKIDETQKILDSRTMIAFKKASKKDIEGLIPLRNEYMKTISIKNKCEDDLLKLIRRLYSEGKIKEENYEQI